jgi:hypothetical protein
LSRAYFFGVFILISLSLAATLKAQDDDVINPERPGLTNPPSVVTPKKIQIESGFFYESDKVKDTELKTDNYLYPTTLFRYGLMKNIELRLEVDVAGVSRSDGGTKLSSVSGLFPVIVGTKFHLFDQKRSRPEAAFVFMLALPYFGKDEFRPAYPAPYVSFFFQNTLSKKTTLGYNLGMLWNGNDPNPTAIATISPSYNFTKKLSGFVELYSFYSKGSVPDFRCDGGFAYIALPNLQLDVSGGVGIAGPTSNYTISAGIAFRLPK